MGGKKKKSKKTLMNEKKEERDEIIENEKGSMFNIFGGEKKEEKKNKMNKYDLFGNNISKLTKNLNNMTGTTLDIIEHTVKYSNYYFVGVGGLYLVRKVLI